MKLLSALSALICFVPLAAWAGPVDINTADAATLAKELNGVGPARAQAIVAYRTQNGPFKSVDDLALVKNMPKKIIEANRENIRVESSRSAQVPAKPATARPTEKSGSKPAPAPR